MTTIEATKILNVELSSSIEEITKKYRQLAKKYHPDICKKPECEEKFKEINMAYEILKKYVEEDLNTNINFEHFYRKDVFEEWLNEQGIQTKDFEEIDINVTAIEVLNGSFIEISSNDEKFNLKLSPFTKNNEQIIYETDKTKYIINIKIKKEQGFFIDEDGKILKEIYIPYIYFLIGGKIILNNLKENFLLNLTPGIKPGQIIKIPNKAPNNQDLYVKLNINLKANGEKKELENIFNKYYKNNNEIY